MPRPSEQAFDMRIARRSIRQEQDRYREERERHSKLSSEELAEELDYRCAYCGELRIPIQRESKPVWESKARVHWYFADKHGCPQETLALRWQEAEQKTLEWRLAQLKRQRILETTGLVGKLEFTTFRNFLPRVEWPEAIQVKQRVMAYCETMIREDFSRPWLILYGNFGTGKTHLAASIVHKAIEAGWEKVYFRIWPEYLRRIETTFSPSYKFKENAESRADISQELSNGRLIVIDDLDKRRPRQFTRDELYEPLNHRYLRSLPTILTFNLDPTLQEHQARVAIEEYIGLAILDRISEVAFDLIDFDGPSYRSNQLAANPLRE